MTPSPTVLCVIGTRPEAIKMAPVVRALRRSCALDVKVLVTGQHRGLLDQALADLGLRGDVNLDVMRPDQTLSTLAARLLEGLDAVLASDPPRMVLAQGDTTTVFATAVACFHRRIPFGHVEAGLRTGDLDQPFPEEFNRVVASRAASLNFAPTERARRALLQEGIDPSRLHVTGNTVIDALLDVARRIPPHLAQARPGRRQVLLTLHRRESFGAPAEAVLGAVRQLCARFADLEILFPVHPNPNVMHLAHRMLGDVEQVQLVEPLGYPDMVAAIMRSTFILTDSGGLQEEAPALGKPVLVLRDVTERPEAVDLGVARLVGTDPERILEEATGLLTDRWAYAAMAKGVSPYGDGQAGERIAALVAEALLPAAGAERSLPAGASPRAGLRPMCSLGLAAPPWPAGHERPEP